MSNVSIGQQVNVSSVFIGQCVKSTNGSICQCANVFNVSTDQCVPRCQLVAASLVIVPVIKISAIKSGNSLRV